MSPRYSLAILAIVSVAFIGACNRDLLTGPPELRLGRDECGECGMLINEDRCSSALLVDNAGRREHILYDDVGCMLDAERDGLSGRSVLERYVHDHDTKRWVSASAATFVLVDPKAVQTPMGSGILAYQDRAKAEATQRAHSGQLLDWAGLHPARKNWMEARYGKPKPRPE